MKAAPTVCITLVVDPPVVHVLVHCVKCINIKKEFYISLQMEEIKSKYYFTDAFHVDTIKTNPVLFTPEASLCWQPY